MIEIDLEPDHPRLREKRMMAGHSRWKTLQAKRLAETGDAAEHPEYEQAGRDLRLGDQLRAIRRSRNLTQKEVAERAGISQPALSRIELGGGVPDIETLQRLGRAMGVRFRIIVGDENAEQEESLLVSLASRACRRGLREDVQEKVRRLVPALVRDSDSAADRSRDGTITMTKHSEQLPRPAAELERLAEYYDTHDTSTEMDNGDWVEPQPMATTSRLTPPQRRRDQPQRQCRKAVSHHHLGAWDRWVSRILRGFSARSFGSKVVAERDGNGAAGSAGQGLGAAGVCVPKLRSFGLDVDRDGVERLCAGALWPVTEPLVVWTTSCRGCLLN